MKDSEAYRVSGKGEAEFISTITAAKEWIERNGNGPVTLTFSISLKITPPEGEMLRTIMKTESMFPSSNRSEQCIGRHHTRCKQNNCVCSCHTAKDNHAQTD